MGALSCQALHKTGSDMAAMRSDTHSEHEGRDKPKPQVSIALQ